MSGIRVVSYHGVHARIPASWPVIDGMHAGYCEGPFSGVPTAYLGPHPAAAPSCTPPLGAPPKYDGLWLRPGARPTTEVRTVTTPAGHRFLELQVAPYEAVRSFWYHGVLIDIGIGPDPSVSRGILDSIEFAPHTADTRAADVCAVSRHPNTMPSPEKLAGAIVLNNGAITLDPPPASAQAVVSAASIWKKDLDRAAFERLRLILALYSAKLPARQEPDGSLVPLYQGVLSWVVYSVPRSPKISGCGSWGVQVFDATSGEPIIASGWAPGP